MQSHGVSDMRLSFLFILFSIGTIVSQPPVVALTARLGARRTLVLGQLFKIFAFALWVLWPTWVGFMVGMFVWGMQSGFYAVTFEGMLYDEMAARHHRDMYTRVLGRRYAFETSAAAVSALGSLMMIWGYGWVTVASLLSVLMSILWVGRMRLTARRCGAKRVAGDPVRLSRLLGRGLDIAWKNPCILTAMMVALVVLNFAYLEDYLGPIGLQIGLPVAYVGVMQFVVLGASLVGQTIAGYGKGLRDRILFLLIGIGGACFIGFGLTYSVSALGLLGLAYVIFKGANVLLYARFQMAVPARYRSVMLSVYTTLNHAMYIGICVLIGWGGEMGSWRYSICILGALLTMLGLGALVAPRRCGVKLPSA